MANLNKSHSQAALVNSITEGIKLQSQNRPQRARKAANETEGTNNVASYNNTPHPSAPSTPIPGASAAIPAENPESVTGISNNFSNTGTIAMANSETASILANSSNSQNSNGKSSIFAIILFKIFLWIVATVYLKNSDQTIFKHFLYILWAHFRHSVNGLQTLLRHLLIIYYRFDCRKFDDSVAESVESNTKTTEASEEFTIVGERLIERRGRDTGWWVYGRHRGRRSERAFDAQRDRARF